MYKEGRSWFHSCLFRSRESSWFSYCLECCSNQDFLYPALHETYSTGQNEGGRLVRQDAPSRLPANPHHVPCPPVSVNERTETCALLSPRNSAEQLCRNFHQQQGRLLQRLAPNLNMPNPPAGKNSAHSPRPFPVYPPILPQSLLGA